MARILIVEDNPDSMKLFRTVLVARGHAVLGLPGGERLLETIRAERPDVILLDVQLPGQDGFQLLERLKRSDEGLPPVIALTAHAMAGDREKALAAGFDGYLTKPIEVTKFGQAVEAFVNQKNKGSEGSHGS